MLVMVIVPAFAQGKQGKEKVVAAVIIGLVTFAADQVRDGVNGRGCMEEHDRADEEPPNH
jgi:hypothetical protein